jgi:hypothetical protein
LPVTVTLVPTGPDEGLRVILGVAACTVGAVDATRKRIHIDSTAIAAADLATYFLFIFIVFPFFNVIYLILLYLY